MKQDIICPTCRYECKKRFGDSLEPYHGKYLKYVEGDYSDENRSYEEECDVQKHIYTSCKTRFGIIEGGQ